jgi:hypothetical protein
LKTENKIGKEKRRKKTLTRPHLDLAKPTQPNRNPWSSPRQQIGPAQNTSSSKSHARRGGHRLRLRLERLDATATTELHVPAVIVDYATTDDRVRPYKAYEGTLTP